MNAPVRAERRMARATALGVLLTAAGSMAGLVRDLTLAGIFGATGETDAFLVAWTVPETAAPLLLDGGMALLMVPFFVRATGDRGLPRAAITATLPRLVLILTCLSVGVALAAPLVVAALAPGLANPEVAVRCTRYAGVTVLAFGLAGYLSAAQRSQHRFGPPAAVYLAYNVGIVGAVVLLSPELGIAGAAVGLGFGGVLMVTVLVPGFLRSVGPAGAGGGRVERLGTAAVFPVFAFTVARQGQVFVERFLGSHLAPGTISHLNYAQKVGQLPMVLAVVYTTVTFTVLARSLADGDVASARHRLEWDLRLVAAVVLACTAYLVAFAPVVISVLFGRGAFTDQDVAATAAILRVYTLGLVGHSVVAVMGRSYFAGGRHLWPAAAMGSGLILTAALATALVGRWGALGIAGGNVAGILLAATLMLAGQHRSGAPLRMPTVLPALGLLCVAAVAAGGVGWWFAGLMSGQPPALAAPLGAVVVLVVFGLVTMSLGPLRNAPWSTR